jgi:hypothetical protein
VCSDDEKSPIRPHHPRVNAHDKTVGEKQEASPNNYFISLLDNALIVLPEGFHICAAYRRRPNGGGQAPNFDPSVLCDLALVSSDFDCAFVAGVIIRDHSKVHPPYSSAYLVDGFGTRWLLTHKVGKDNTEINSTDESTANTPRVEAFTT